jgi:hypothetical protein
MNYSEKLETTSQLTPLNFKHAQLFKLLRDMYYGLDDDKIIQYKHKSINYWKLR